MDESGPLERLSLQLHHQTLGSLYESSYDPRRADSYRYDLNPPYQRGDVWGVEQRRNLIRSLLMGLPIGVVFVNQRPGDLESDTVLGHVVDGKQRITTIQMFAADGFVVPACWFPREDVLAPEACRDMSEAEGVRYSGLAPRSQRRFGNIPTGVYHSHLADVESERDLYLLINFGGVPQADEDRARAASITTREG